MITKLKIVNFKSHKETNLQLGNLTVLSGQNGVGKSSVIQSLLLLRQTFQKNRLDKVLDLNNPLCFVGKSEDALYRFSKDNELSFTLNENKNEYSWSFKDFKDKNKTYLERSNNITKSKGFEDLSLFANNFQYLSASRNLDYVSDDYAVEIQNQISIKEGKGELIAQFLNEYGKKIKVIDYLKHKSENDDFLLSQVTAWEREVSINVNIQPVQIDGAYDIKYSFDTLNKELGPVDEISKRNVGFGLSFALPVITAILSSKENSLVIIENPEAHIHPYGIAKLCELICRASQIGIQIIVETHSDHIINGILVQSKKFETSNGIEGIDKNNIKLYYLKRDEKEHATNAMLLPILVGGKIQRPPKGFFDQLDIDMDELIGL